MFRKSSQWIGSVFLAFGLLFGGVGLAAAISDWRFAKDAVRAQGFVTGFANSRSSDSTTYAPIVIYRDRTGTIYRFRGKVASNPPAFDMQESVDVLYRPERPGAARIDSFGQRHFLSLIFGGFGLVFGGIGAAFLAQPVMRRRKIARLRRSGVRIPAQIIDVFRDTGRKSQGRSPFRIAAQGKHPATNRIRRFESDPIWIDPTDLVGDSIDVLVFPEPGDRRYHVELPPEIAEG